MAGGCFRAGRGLAAAAGLLFLCLSTLHHSAVAQTMDFQAALVNADDADLRAIRNDPDVAALTEASYQVPPPDPAVVDAVIAGGPAAEEAATAYLTDGNPSPQTVSARVVALARALSQHPATQDNKDLLYERSVLVADLMSRALCAPRLIRVDVDENFLPPPGTIAFDLGGYATPAAVGFAEVTPWNSQLFGGASKSVDFVREGALIRDMVVGVDRLELNVPNGEYRVIMLTSADVVGQAPFGIYLVVNQDHYLLGKSSEQDWWDRGRLCVPGGA